MADSETRVQQLDGGSSKEEKRKKERVWTETELKCFATVLADEKKEYAVKLERLALKKSANIAVFEDIAKDFERLLSSDEFRKEIQQEKESFKGKGKRKYASLEITAARLRVKYKFIRNQWRKFTDRVKKGSGKAPIDEPGWFTILNPIFSDTMGEMKVSSSSGDVFLPHDSDNSSDISDSDTPNTSVSGTGSLLGVGESDDDDLDVVSTNH